MVLLLFDYGSTAKIKPDMCRPAVARAIPAQIICRLAGKLVKAMPARQNLHSMRKDRCMAFLFIFCGIVLCCFFCDFLGSKDHPSVKTAESCLENCRTAMPLADIMCCSTG
jgi:hypothetical protein